MTRAHFMIELNRSFGPQYLAAGRAAAAFRRSLAHNHTQWPIMQCGGLGPCLKTLKFALSPSSDSQTPLLRQNLGSLYPEQTLVVVS